MIVNLFIQPSWSSGKAGIQAIPWAQVPEFEFHADFVSVQSVEDRWGGKRLILPSFISLTGAWIFLGEKGSGGRWKCHLISNTEYTTLQGKFSSWPCSEGEVQFQGKSQVPILRSRWESRCVSWCTHLSTGLYASLDMHVGVLDFMFFSKYLFLILPAKVCMSRKVD